MPGTLDELAKSMTHREYLTRMAAIESEWDEPSRTDHYLMQIAYYIVAANSEKKDQKRIKFDSFKMTFTDEREEGKPLSAEASKTMWTQIAAVGRREQNDRATSG